MFAPRRAPAVAAACLLVGFLADPAWACSVCLAGDPIYSSQGASAQPVGQVSAYVELRGWRKKSGVLPGEAEGDATGAPPSERNQSQRLDLYLSWTPIDRLTLTLDIPWAFNRTVTNDGGTSTHAELSGLGDVAFGASGVLWRNREILPSTWVEGRLWLKVPSGASSQRVDGEKDPHLQVGTGSWDFGYGFAVVHRLEWGSLYGSVFHRLNTEGNLQYRYGDSVLVNAALDVPIGHALGVPWLERFSAGAELNLRASARDEFQGDRYRDSGGTILYATPSLRVRLPWLGGRQPPFVRAAVQIPTTSAWLHGQQKEKAVWSLGLGYSF